MQVDTHTHSHTHTHMHTLRWWLHVLHENGKQVHTVYVNPSETHTYVYMVKKYRTIYALSVAVCVKHNRCIFLFWGLCVVHFPAFCYFVAHKFVHARAAMCDDLYPLQPTNSTVVVFLLLSMPLSLSVPVSLCFFSWSFSFFFMWLFIAFSLFVRVVCMCMCIFIHSIFSYVYLIFSKLKWYLCLFVLLCLFIYFYVASQYLVHACKTTCMLTAQSQCDHILLICLHNERALKRASSHDSDHTFDSFIIIIIAIAMCLLDKKSQQHGSTNYTMHQQQKQQVVVSQRIKWIKEKTWFFSVTVIIYAAHFFFFCIKAISLIVCIRCGWMVNE